MQNNSFQSLNWGLWIYSHGDPKAIKNYTINQDKMYKVYRTLKTGNGCFKCNIKSRGNSLHSQVIYVKDFLRGSSGRQHIWFQSSDTVYKLFDDEPALIIWLTFSSTFSGIWLLIIERIIWNDTRSVWKRTFHSKTSVSPKYVHQKPEYFEMNIWLLCLTQILMSARYLNLIATVKVSELFQYNVTKPCIIIEHY